MSSWSLDDKVAMVHECFCIVLCCTATEQTGAKFCAQTGSICTHTSQCTLVTAELQSIQKQTQQMHNQGCCCFLFFHQQKTKKCRENANTKSDPQKRFTAWLKTETLPACSIQVPMHIFSTFVHSLKNFWLPCLPWAWLRQPKQQHNLALPVPAVF